MNLGMEQGIKEENSSRIYKPAKLNKPSMNILKHFDFKQTTNMMCLMATISNKKYITLNYLKIGEENDFII